MALAVRCHSGVCARLLVSHLGVTDAHILTSVALICQPDQRTKVNKMGAK